MAAYSDINGFPEAGFPVLSDVSDRVCLNTLYWNPLKEAGFILDVVGNNRLAGNLSLAGMLSGVTSITMNGALSGVSTITANGTATLTSSNPLSLTAVNANIRMPGLNSSIGSVLERVYKGYFKNLDVANTLTVNGDDVALIGDIKRYVSGTSNTLPKYNATGITDSKFTDDGTTPKYNTNTIWHSGNDGAGSGLDSDSIDGYQGSSIMASKRLLINNENLDNIKEIGSYVNHTGNGSGNSNFPNSYGIINVSGDGGNYGGIQSSYDANNGDLSYRMNWGGWQPWRKVWDNKNSNLSTVDWTTKNVTTNGLHSHLYNQALLLKSATTGYGSGFRYDTNGSETLIVSTTNSSSKIMFACGHDVTIDAGVAPRLPLSPILTLSSTDIKIGSLSGYLKGTAGVVGAVSSIPESDITPTAYSTLTVTSNATTWDCSTGLNKRVTISANLALTMTNLVDGMSGDLVVNVSSISSITIATTGFTQKKYGSLTSKPVGKYHLCWICEGTNIDFNITDTPYA